jgi:hypothetical protein
MSVVSDFASTINDPMYIAMMSGAICWGDLFYDEPMTPAVVEEPVVAPEPLPFGWDFEYPELRLRKDIWENFPVTVVPLGSGGDGAERHAIVWHRRNLEEWRNTHTDSFLDAMDYPEITEYRLLKCLEASKYWTVEEPVADGQIAVIRMNFVPRTTEVAPAATPTSSTPSTEAENDGWTKVAAKPTKLAVPLLTRLNDIKGHFPVVWHKVETARTRTAVYAVEIFGKKLAEMSSAAGKDVRADVEERLMAALRASPAWRVLRSEGREFCRIEMA